MSPSTKKFIRALFWRKTQDNQTRPGFIWAALLFAIVVGGIYTATRPKTQYSTGGPTQSPRGVGAFAKVDTERAVTAGATFAKVDPLQSTTPDPLTQSNRTNQPVSRGGREATEVAETATPESSFLDTVRQATEAQQPPAAQGTQPTHSRGLPDGFIDEGESGVQATVRARGEPTGGQLAGQPVAVGQPIQVQAGSIEMSGLTVYKRDLKVKSTPGKKTGFETGNFLPKGQKVPVAFVNKVTTLDLSGMVELAVTENVKFGGDVVRLPYGTRIYGTASTKNVSDRISIRVDTIVFPEDGSEIAINGVTLDVDGQPGVRGYYNPQPAGVQAFPYINTAAIGLLESLKKTGATQTADGVTLTNQNSFGNTALTAGQQGVADALRRQQEELDKRYPAYVLVKAGTAAIIQLTTALDLNARKVNAAVQKDDEPPAASVQKLTNAVMSALPLEGNSPALRPNIPKS